MRSRISCDGFSPVETEGHVTFDRSGSLDHLQSMRMTSSQAFMDALACQLAHELTGHGTLRGFVGRNTALIGAYAEASVRRFITRVVSPLQVSTGTIVYEDNFGKNPPQLDVIIWSPTIAPAIFESGEFAVVPRGSAHAYLEIKASHYKNTVGKDIARTIAHGTTLIWPNLGAAFKPAMGVVCLKDTSHRDPALDALVKNGDAVVLMDIQGARIVPRPPDVWTLVSFLLSVRRRAKDVDGALRPKYPPG